jgi:peptide/nickel transport system substrate-binding protein
MIGMLSSRNSINLPVRGGTLKEGIVGTPRFVNPVLAVSDADRDLSSLVYSGLMRLDENGTPQIDLADSYTVSPDGKTYTFILRSDAMFHDGEKVTANDVVYTINQIQHPLIDSPKKANWQGITVTKLDDMSVAFVLKQPFSPFLELATVGILPVHLWGELSTEEFAFSAFNINAIGSGPYEINSVNRNGSGIADEFILTPNNDFNLGKPYIAKIAISSYANERELANALSNGNIDIASGLSPERAKALAEKGANISSQRLPRVFGLFMNKNQNPIFSDPAVVGAVKNAINKKQIIDTVLSGYGTAIQSPIPSIFARENTATDTVIDPVETLEKAGWLAGEDGKRKKTDAKTKTTTDLAFSITTADTPELVATADILKENLEAIGFTVQVKIYSLGDLNQDIIRPRDYDALLFGQFVTDTGSLYAFWHSSQTEDPGLNVAMYKSAVVDKALSDLFSANESEGRQAAISKMVADIEKNAPVAFLYSPLYLEGRRGIIERSRDSDIILPSDRFRDVHTWYLETEKVWKFFIKN